MRGTGLNSGTGSVRTAGGGNLKSSGLLQMSIFAAPGQAQAPTVCSSIIVLEPCALPTELGGQISGKL